MAGSSYESVELRLVEAGSELAPAIEAAQYGRVVDHDDPQAPAEAEAIARFVEAFASAAEDWESLGAGQRTVRLAQFGDHLETLEAAGLHVHVGTLLQRFAASGGVVALPVAVLTIGRTALPTRQVLLPARLEVEQDTLH
jgi:hypothetical protein